MGLSRKEPQRRPAEAGRCRRADGYSNGMLHSSDWNEETTGPISQPNRWGDIESADYNLWDHDRLSDGFAAKPRPRSARLPELEKRRGAGQPVWSFSLAGIVWLTIGLGLCVDGLAVTVAPRNYGAGLLLFWAAVFIPFVILMVILVAGRPSRALRELVIALVGLYPTVMYRMSSPLVLGGFDEHLHERTLVDLLHGGGLFEPNPLLPVSPYYPGMEIFTGVATRLTDMPMMLAMSLVVVLCRLLLVLTIYHCALTVLPSPRGASLVVLFYAASPQFYYFNSQFAYQTMALTLGLGGIFLLRRAQLAEGASARRLCYLAMLPLIATVVTHHVTSWIILAFLSAWAIITPRDQRKVLVEGAVVMATGVAIWSVIVGNRLVSYLGPVISAVLQQVDTFEGRSSSQHKLFTTTAGSVTPEWQKAVLVVYALSCTGVAAYCGWKLLGRAFRKRDRMLGFLGASTLVYPITLAAHFLPAAGSLGDRASTFFFFPLALSYALVITHHPRLTRRLLRDRSRTVLAAFIGLVGFVYLGGVMLGGGPNWELLPGQYLVSADPRTQDPQTLAAVRWAATHLPEGSRIVADRVPGALLSSQARMWPLFAPQNGLEPAWLYFSPTWGSYETAVVRGLHIRYLYVDERLANSLPYVGYYFDQGETPQPERITKAELAKFAHVQGLKAVYHHGPVTIYETSGLGVASTRNGFVGTRSMGLGTLGDALWGAAVALVTLALRRRLAWLASFAREARALGSGVCVMAVTVVIGGVLFGLRLMPGPAFTVGVVFTGALALGIGRLRSGLRLSLPIPLPRRLDPLIILGFIMCVAGLAIGIRAAWTTDVSAVNAILRNVAAGGKG
jgi:hypothetical protein